MRQIHDYTTIQIYNVPAAQKKLGILPPTPQAVLSGHGAPTVAPSTDAAIYIDVDTGNQYLYYGGAWH